MPRYYFDVEDGHRSVDPSGSVFKNDRDAIERAEVIAIGVSLDKPEIDPTRHIAVLNEAKVEIFKVPVYSKPAANRLQHQPGSERRQNAAAAGIDPAFIGAECPVEQAPLQPGGPRDAGEHTCVKLFPYPRRRRDPIAWGNFDRVGSCLLQPRCHQSRSDGDMG